MSIQEKTMIDHQRYGAGCLLSRPEVFVSRAHMLDHGEIGHVQLLIIPDSPHQFERQIEVYEPYQGYIRIHAPHHLHQVNPCAPGLYGEGKEPIAKYLDQAMSQTFEAADRTGSDIIVLHAGRFLQGQKEDAIETFHDFLDQYPDRRYVLENLPDIPGIHPFLGMSPDELRVAGENRVSGYCIDFPHLWCTSVRNQVPYGEMLTGMATLPIRFSHLSGSPGPHTDRQHLFFDDPDNRFCPDWIIPFLNAHPNLEISLEFGTDDPMIIREQLEIVTSL